MFGKGVFCIPGNELREFTVLQPDSRETENGRILNNMYIPICKIKAVFAEAKPEEKERWRQLEHPITHKIIQQGITAFKINPGYILERAGRKFYIQTQPYNVGDLNYWTIYYCQERTDVI